MIDRNDDFRGCGPMYRAGSILSGDGDCPVDVAYGGSGNLYSNAGNYGVTSPISPLRRSPSTTETRPRPVQSPEWEAPIFEPNGSVPDLDDLIKQPRNTSPMPTPLMPPSRPRVTPPIFDDTSDDSIPFSPSDAPVPLSGFPIIMDSDDPPITLEELRRLDPSVRDVQIISIEDAAVGTNR